MRRIRLGDLPVEWAGTVTIMAIAVGLVAWIGVTTSFGPAAVMVPSNADVAAQANHSPGQPYGVAPEYSPWQPGTKISVTTERPQAGHSFDSTACTVALSFDDAAGNQYAVTASHCGSVGDLVWSQDARNEVDFLVEYGHIIYSSLQEVDTTNPDAVGTDIGIIQISPLQRTMPVAADVLHTTVIADIPTAGLPVCKLGGTTGLTCGRAVDDNHVYAMDHPETGHSMLTTGARARLCAQRGDSGGPLFTTIDGHQVIIGLVSGTERVADGPAICGDNAAKAGQPDSDVVVAYSTAADILATIRAVVPTARLRAV